MAHDADRRPSVLERVTLIVDCLAEAPGRLTLEEVAEITGVPRTTAFRMLRQLVDIGWADRSPGGYATGPSLARRGATSDFEELRSWACPVLNELASETGWVAHLGVMIGGFVHYLDKIGGGVAASVPSGVGARAVAAEATCGLAILAYLPDGEVDSIVGYSGAARGPDGVSLRDGLEAVRRRGFSFHDGDQRASGVSSIGAAIVGPAGPVAAISVARRGPLSLRTVSPLVVRAADTVGLSLFGDWAPDPRLRTA